MKTRITQFFRPLPVVLALVCGRSDAIVQAADGTGVPDFGTGRSPRTSSSAAREVDPESVLKDANEAAPESLALTTVTQVPQSASSGLTTAEVERIVAEYVAKREQERSVAADFASQSKAADIAAMPEPIIVGADKSLSAKWNNGLELESKNKEFKVHVGGRTQFDTSFFQNDGHLEAAPPPAGIGSLQDSMQFRRARLRVDGSLYEQIEFAFEYELLNDVSVAAGPPVVATTVPAATDLWVNFSKLPILGNVKIGNQKDPLGFEHLMSSRYLDFIERSFNQDLFYGPFNNGFSPGISVWNLAFDKRVSHTVGVFAANQNAGTNIFGYGLGNDYTYASRVTWLPYYDGDGRYLIHLGSSYEYRNSDDGRIRVRTRGNIRNGSPGPFNSVYADTTLLAAQGQALWNLEFAAVAGPWTLQSEYCLSNIYQAFQVAGVPAPIDRGNVFVHGGYVEVLYYLTGEHRSYSFERAAFDRVVPHSNAFRLRSPNARIIQGPGAWQVGFRYDHADLNNSGINGGTLNGYTLGLNWFFNPNMKFQWNWDWTHRGQVGAVAPGDVFGFGTRLAIDF